MICDFDHDDIVKNLCRKRNIYFRHNRKKIVKKAAARGTAALLTGDQFFCMAFFASLRIRGLVAEMLVRSFLRPSFLSPLAEPGFGVLRQQTIQDFLVLPAYSAELIKS